MRWAEVDIQKVVFNGHYLTYFDVGVTAYWRQLALPYHATMEALGGDLFVRKASLEYLAPAHFDDRLTVGVRLLRLGTSSFTLQACVFKDHHPLVHGEMVYVFADPSAQRSLPLPQTLRVWMEAHEAGEPMVEVSVGSWNQWGPLAQALRTTVFVEEQGVPVDLERDDLDQAAVHAVALNRMGHAVGTGRLVLGANGESARIGRMAVSSTVRSAGVGGHLLAALVAAARDRGVRQVELHAQDHAIAFYRRFGFQAQGPIYQEAGIPHQTMRLTLS